MPTWATVGEFKNYLYSAGIIELPLAEETALFEYENALTAAKTAIEIATGYKPFIASGTDVTVKYTPCGTILDLLGGFADITSVELSGTALVEDETWFAAPATAPSEGKPYTYLEFSSYIGGALHSLEVTGKRGYCLANALPQDIRQAQMAFAASELAPIFGQKMSGGVVKWVRGDASEDYGGKPLSGFASESRASYDAIIKRYKRLRVA